MKATKIARGTGLRFVGAVLLLGMVACTPPGPAALLDGESLLEEGEHIAAIKKLQEATDLLPDKPEAWNFLGLAFHRAGKPEEASKAYQRALQLNVDFLTARFNLGCLLLENQEFEAAENQFKTYEILDDQNPHVSVMKGSAQLGAGKFAEAEQSFESGLTVSREFPEAWNGLGLIRRERGLATRAFHYFNTAIEQDSNYGPAYLNQALVAHHDLEDLSLALQKYRRFMFLEPNSPMVPRIKEVTAEIEEILRPKPTVAESPTQPEPETQAAEDQSDSEETTVIAQTEELPSEGAAATIEQGETGDPKPGTGEGKETVEDGKDKETVVAVVAVDTELGPGPVAQSDEVTSPITGDTSTNEMAQNPPTFEPPVKEDVAEEPVQTASFETIEDTEPEYDFAIGEDQPENVTSQDLENEGWRTVSTRRSGLGISVGRQMFRNVEGDDQTKQSSTGSVEKVPSVPYQFRNPSVPSAGNRLNADPFFQKGNEAFRADRPSEAILAYREAVSRDPAFFEAHYNMGLAAIKSGLAETALDAYEMALAIMPNDRNARYNFALALEQGRHHTEAASELETLLGQHSDDVHAHFTLATLYAKKIGNAELARSHYERVLELDPNYSKAVSIRYWLSASD